MRVIIVEDEKPAATHLKWLLNNIDSTIEVIAEFDTVREASKELPKIQADLIFLDIHLADDISFKIFENIKVSTPVIFTTAYDQYAIKAFQLNSIDYLLKPIEQHKLEGALQKFESLKDSFSSNNEMVQKMMEMLSPQKKIKSRFMVEAGKKIISVKAEDVAFFSSEEKYTFLTTFDNRSYPINNSLDKLELELDQSMFFRINRKFIINIDSIDQIYYLSTSKIKLDLKPSPESDTIVSIRRLKAFKEWLEN
jgi:two-component system response regulator LytT